ncbi:hypothetical protein I203_107284 [Kwoniella mangroviensis CBS 8507]|uniref:hypothetical protein n=1 Tax=Kwoniella mangroviensis CBS 8507 TaxID=1296122 RepID=UPI00304E6C01
MSDKALEAAKTIYRGVFHPIEDFACSAKKGKLGVIAEGAIADLLVLSRNPLEDITVLDRPELYLDAVSGKGKVVSWKI